MQLSLSVDGGFAPMPGLRQPVTVDVDKLPTEQASEAHRLLDASNFFAQPAVLPPPTASAADYREYTITADGGDGPHTVKVPEIGAPPELLELVDWLQERARASTTRRGRGGKAKTTRSTE